MTRLPIPGSDKNTWGDVLNGFLAVAHNSDGSLNGSSIVSAGAVTSVNGVAASNGAVTIPTGNATSLNGVSLSGTPANGQTLQYNGSSWVPATVTSSGTVPNADTGTAGIIKLAGDLDGQYNSVTVAKVRGTTVSTTAPTSGQVLAATGTNTAAWTTLNTGNATSLNGITLSGTPTNGQALQYNGTTWSPATVTSSGSVSDAAPGTKGIVSLNGDIAGTSTAVKVTGIQGAAVSATAPTAGQVLAATSGTALAWSTLSASSLGALVKTNNLSDLTDANAARTSLGLGTAATVSATTAGDLTGTLPAPTVAKVRGITISTTAPTNGQVLTATSATAAQWTTPATSGGSGVGFTPVPMTAGGQVASMSFVLANASSSGFNVTLPAAAGGAWVRVKKLDSSVNSVLVVGANSSTIDGGASFSVNSQYMSQDFMSDGTNWYLI